MPSRRDLERILQKVGARRAGVATRSQLRAAGLSEDVIDRLLAADRITRIQRGVYRITPVALPGATEHAALLAGGPRARLSHCTAARLHSLGDDVPVQLEVSLPRGSQQRIAGCTVHRIRAFHDDETQTRDGLRVTTIARTLLDLAESVPRRIVEQAFATALRRRAVTPAAMSSMIARHPYHRGAPLWRELLSAGDPAFARSRAEHAFLSMIDRAELARPETNVELRGYQLDFLWRAERVVAEMDGYVFHMNRRSFGRDRRRVTDLGASGYCVLQFTWDDLHEGSLRSIARLSAALSRASA